MHPVEYAHLARLDRAHWFYRGKRAIVRYWLERSIKLGHEDLLIDAGMGAGTWLEEMSGTCRVLGLDDHDESLAIAGPRLKAAGGASLKSSLERTPLPDSTASAVTALDVLEHLDDDAGALCELVRLVRPGGVIVLTVPALPFLWSDWDVALHHRRRYLRSDLERLIEPLHVEMIRLAYFNVSAVLPIWLIRRWRRSRPGMYQSEWAEHRLPGPFWNKVLQAGMVWPSRWRWFRPPFGVSLLAVLRKREGIREARSTEAIQESVERGG